LQVFGKPDKESTNSTNLKRCELYHCTTQPILRIPDTVSRINQSERLQAVMQHLRKRWHRQAKAK